MFKGKTSKDVAVSSTYGFNPESAGAGHGFLSNRIREIEMDEEFTGPFPRYSGAISAVTGGSPEDMNEMPAALNPKNGCTIYDGSDLKPSRPNFIPDEAIRISGEERAAPSVKKNEPPVDEYSSEKISPNAPSDSDVKSGPVDDTVMPG
jgi:hypothetical protein